MTLNANLQVKRMDKAMDTATDTFLTHLNMNIKQDSSMTVVSSQSYNRHKTTNTNIAKCWVLFGLGCNAIHVTALRNQNTKIK